MALQANAMEGLDCPKCRQRLRRTSWGYACTRECGFKLSGEVARKKLPHQAMKALLRKRVTPVVKGFSKKDGSGKFDAALVLDEEYKLKFVFEQGSELHCPKCRKSLRKMTWGYACDRECGFRIGTRVGGKTLSASAVKRLFETGATGMIKGFKKKDGSGRFDAKLILDNNFRLQYSFDRTEMGLCCPQCEGEIVRFVKGYKCKDEAGCGLIVWNSFLGKKLSESQMRKLIKEGRTSKIAGFKSRRTGKTFDAGLVLKDDGKVGLEF